MTVKDVTKDPATLTMVVTAEFDAPVERVWQLWADPRQLERWWGPPTYPATVVDHDLVPGGTVTYFMTGPEGDKHGGWWRVLAVDAPHSLEVQDGFSDDTGSPNPDMPSTIMRVVLSEQGGGTKMVMTSTFPSLEAMERLTDMGMEEGLRAAMAQMDEVLAA
ncbi:MAG: SRPBCC family protein [Acidimicrobiales bacterium]